MTETQLLMLFAGLTGALLVGVVGLLWHLATGARASEPAALKPGERIEPPAPPAPDAKDDESPHVWGFADTKFVINARGHVELTGGRYELCADELPSLLPWVRKTMELELPPDDVNKPAYPPQIAASRASDDLLAALRDLLGADNVSTDDEQRLRHGHGHTQEEMFGLKHQQPLARIPDVVVHPTSDEHVVGLVQLARDQGACLIPYGGGTNVTDALRCPEDEARSILSVDMRRMNRVLWIDPVNRMAKIQAGAVGRHIFEMLEPYGFTMGHEPDSVEFSTLGGWVATHASGMKKNRYGNIEDILVDVDVVTADGSLERHDLNPRESIGSDPRRSILGSEGNLGIVTAAVVRLFPLPEVKEYGSVLFPDFDAGVSFLYDLQQTATPPASARLVDNMQFQFGQALKPAKKGALAKLISKLQKWYVLGVKGFDPERMTALTLVFEGSRAEVARQEADVYRIARRYGGMPAGAENGARGYQLTYGIAYIRDFVLDHWILAESFETSVPWTGCVELCERVKARLREAHARRGLPGKPFVTCRVTQVYPTGVCIYFYFAYYYKGVEDPTQVYLELEHEARDEILACGGSLSHHHGIGKIRRRYLPRIMSQATLAWRARTKQAVDPDNLFGARNTGVGPGELEQLTDERPASDGVDEPAADAGQPVGARA